MFKNGPPKDFSAYNWLGSCPRIMTWTQLTVCCGQKMFYNSWRLKCTKIQEKHKNQKKKNYFTRFHY